MSNIDKKGPITEGASGSMSAECAPDADPDTSHLKVEEKTYETGKETTTNGTEGSEATSSDAAATHSDNEATQDETPLEDESADLKDKLLRALADTENLRRRSQKDLEDARKYAAVNFARDILSVADNLRRAIEALPEQDSTAPNTLDGLIEGISLTEKELLSTLERHGIKKLDPLEQKFDPKMHEAMYEVPTTNADIGTIVQVVEVGYIIHDRLLRPAKVGVAKAVEPSPASAADQD